MSDEPKHESEFETRTREALDESTAKLDGRTLSRLNQARHAALAQTGRPVHAGWRGWVPAGAAVAAVVLAVMIWTRPLTETAAPPTASSTGSSAFEDIDLLADAPEFVGEADDLEFYAWAADELES